jgi:hypothetical protein
MNAGDGITAFRAVRNRWSRRPRSLRMGDDTD